MFLQMNDLSLALVDDSVYKKEALLFQEKLQLSTHYNTMLTESLSHI